MPNSQHKPWLKRRNFKGANTDVDPEILGEGDDGSYIDSRNGRPSAMEGHTGSWDKIEGEVSIYPQIDNSCGINNTGLDVPDGYKCIGIAHFFYQHDNNDHIIEFWADKLKVNPSIIRIDGKIVLRSLKFPIDVDHPLQLDVNNSCIGGEIYITDFFHQPMIFSLKDLMVNSGLVADDNNVFICTTKYFADFDIKPNTLTLDIPVDHPVFVSISQTAPWAVADDTHITLTGPGFDVGEYQYEIRYATPLGDKTAWSVATPLIPVVPNVSTLSTQYPGVKTYGADIGTSTTFGIHFRFRCVNILDYELIEIKRTKYNLGTAPGTAGIEELLSTSIAITPQQIDVIDVWDSASPGGPITTVESDSVLSAIESAKTLRYYNSVLFLMNIKYASRDLQDKIDFKVLDGEMMFPVKHKLFQQGHSDPYNSTYFRHSIGGEKNGYSVVFFDAKGQNTFALPIPGFENYQIPNRRVEIESGSNSDIYSSGTVTAANVNADVTKTFEVFDMVDAVNKTQKDTFKNIMDNVALALVGKSQATVNSAGSPDPGFGSFVSVSEIGYCPYHPTSQTDTVEDHNYRVNVRVRPSAGGPGEDVDYNPSGFGPNYYSTGMALSGIDLSTLPDWVQSFSILKSKSAKRVFAQGIGFYYLNTAEGLLGANTTKELKKIWFHSQDIEVGMSDIQSVIDDISAGTGRYKLQFVSPLGFFSEVYDGNVSGLGDFSTGIDMITYARVLRENGSINPGDGPANVGVDGGDGYGYTAYGKWRNPNYPNAIQTFPFCQDGERLFDIASVITKTEGRGEYYEIETNDDFFNIYGTGTGHHDFEDGPLKEWHEPLYIINIIDTKADVPNTNIDEFLETGHYQKIDAIIGRSDGTSPQSFMLVDERKEDCIPNFGDTSANKILFVSFNGTSEAWINIAEKNPGQIITILDGIQAGTLTVTFNGTAYTIKGVYSHTENIISDTQSEYTVFFDNNLNPAAYPDSFFIPITDSYIRVRYDSGIPVKSFGGDATIGEAVFAPLDKLYNNNSNPDSGTEDFRINVGFPYRVFEMNPRIFHIDHANGPTNYIADDNTVKFFNGIGNSARNRQLLTMYTCESRSNLPFAYNIENPGAISPDRFFPLVHYIMRPHRWTNSGNILSDYFDDFPDEDAIWGYGGFRFLPNTNIDYSQLPENQKYFGKKKVGFKEETEFCTRVIWSKKRPVNVVDSPGVRTFPALNFFDLSDDTGEIKYAWDDTTDRKGSNLYALTHNGICLLMTDKRILSELTGGQLAAIGSEETSIILEQIWISKVIGMHDEMWRSSGEWDNMLFFTNKNSVYQLQGSQVKDIAREGMYHSRIYRDFLKNLKPGYQDDVSAVYDTLHNEYWITLSSSKRRVSFSDEYTFNIANPIVSGESIELFSITPTGNVFLPETLLTSGQSVNINIPAGSGSIAIYSFGGVFVKLVNATETYLFTYISTDNWSWEAVEESHNSATFAYSDVKKDFVGYFDYLFDKYVSFDNKTYGVRDMDTFQLNTGLIINGEPVVGHLIQAYTPEGRKGHEFIRYRVNSESKPNKVEFFDNMQQLRDNSPISILDVDANALSLRDRDGWEQYIPREILTPFNRVQGRTLISKITHEREEHIKIVDTSIMYKPLK